MSVGDFAFLPNLRGLAAAGAARDGARLVTDYSVQVTGDGAARGAAVAVPAVLKGPGDVIGVMPDQILRVEPEAGLRGFEPNYVPFIEFRDADFPWRYTLDEGTGRRVRPWLVLIALKDGEGVNVARGTAPAPRVLVQSAAASLPPLATSWALAHAQVDMTGRAGEDPADVLSADPARGFSRLICARQLEAATWYTLYLVPACKAGLDAGLGDAPDPALGDAPAWEQTGAPVTLPYYHSARFRTETGQSLEELLEKLRAIRADEVDEAGATRWATTAGIGYYPDDLVKPVEIPLQAALEQPGHKLSDIETPDRLTRRMAATLNRALEAGAGAGDTEDGEDPLLTFPAYGARIAGAARVDPGQAHRGGWVDRLNLDLKLRAAAGLGAAVVRENQESYASLCWDQYAEILAANRELMRLQLASVLAGRLEARHFSAMGPETALRLASPMLPLVAASGERGSASIAERLEASGVPAAWVGRDLARQAGRRVVRAPGKDGTAERRRVAPPIPGDETASAALRPRADSAPLRRIEADMAEGRGEAALREGLRQIFGDGALGRKTRAKVPLAPVRPFRSAEFQGRLSARLTALPRAKADATVSGRTAPEEAALGPVFRAPRLPLPIVNDLRPIDREAILAGVERLPAETVSVHEENRAFVEAVLAGANTAMNEELRWRGFPTDMRGTVLTRFWDRGAAPLDAASDDIGAIRDWAKPLGRNPSPADADGRRDLVVVFKGDVVRKLDAPLVTINVADAEIDPEEFDPLAGTVFEPVFHGKVGRDVVYFGFDVGRDWLMAPERRDRAFAVIHEPPGRLRFGLDVGSVTRRWQRPLTPALTRAGPAPGLQDWDDLSWAHVAVTGADHVRFDRQIAKPPGAAEDYWGAQRSSATLARAFWQKPLAAVLPLARVL